MNIDLPVNIGKIFVIMGFNGIFWYYLISIIFAFNDRRFLFFAALLWTSVKLLQLVFLLSLDKFKVHPSKSRLKLIQRIFFLYILIFISVISLSLNQGLGWFDWIAIIGELFLFLNMLFIFAVLRGPEYEKSMMSYEREKEIEKEKARIVEQKQRVEGQFIVFDPSLHLETIENPHEQLDPWVSKNKHLNYYGEINPFDTLYEKDLENYANQFKLAQESAHQKAADGHNGVIGAMFGWIVIFSLGSILPLIGTIRSLINGNAGFGSYFYLVLVFVLLVLPIIVIIVLMKKGVDETPKYVDQIKPIQRPIVQFYESESELIIVKAETDNFTQNKFNKTDIIGIRSNTGSDRVRRPKTTWDGRPIRGHVNVDVPYNELVLQYFDNDLVERHLILKLDNETFKELTPFISKLQDKFKSDFGRDKHRFKGPSFKVCGACSEIALATDAYCDDCGTLLS